MNRSLRIAIVVSLAVVVSGVLVIKTRRQDISTTDASITPVPEASSTEEPAGSTAEVAESAIAENQPLPRLVELGSVTCIPCKAMAPILDELRQEYSSALQVDFIDVNKNRDLAMKFNIRVIPTQVFLDAGGKELYRHEGFFPKEDILAKWQELGIALKPVKQ